MAFNPEKPSKIKLKKDFSSKVSHLISPNSYKGSSLYAFIGNLAHRWHVGYIDPHEIITEGIKRGIEYIDKHEKAIEKPEAWLRRVCMHILSDRVDQLVKEEKKSERQTYEVNQLTSICPPEPSLLDYLEHLEEALSSLSEDDRMLIRMRFFEDKSYGQIQYHYELVGEVVTLAALRKRESRALKRLRSKFFSLQGGQINPTR